MMDKMTSVERVTCALRGLETDRTPIYGWLNANMTAPISKKYGSVAAFEDKYLFDAAHIFGGPDPYNNEYINDLKNRYGELTPEILANSDFFNSPDDPEKYVSMRQSIEFHKIRNRFCYVQTPGFFEYFNLIFGIENQLMYLALYPEELAYLYQRQLEWDKAFVDHCVSCGADMIHISDDWGAQTNLLFSPNTWKKLIRDPFGKLIDYVHSLGVFASLHSDGCIAPLIENIADCNIDCVHPWQESANMPYSLWLNKYSDRFALLGGVCVQTTLGFGDYKRLEKEIRRVFALLKGKRWICCTTHFVQEHCSLKELEFAYDLIFSLARE